MATNGSDRKATHQAWLDQVEEEVVDPGRRIVDPHHHLWRRDDGDDYLVADLHADTGAGHLVEQTVFVECGASYRTDGPQHLRPVGETTFVAEQAAEAEQAGGAVIAGIVAHADLRLGRDELDEVLDAHEAAGGGRFRGIRHAGARAQHPEAMTIPGRAPDRLYADPAFRAGVAALGERGLTYDTWHHHPRNPEFAELARAAPGTTLVLDHLGTPVGVGPDAGRRQEIFEVWKGDIDQIAANDNVVAKVGGMAMPDNGFGWHEAPTPPTSDEIVTAHAPYYLHVIERFGPDRCMFESNFPVDRLSLSYRVLWNALKKLTAPFSEAEQEAMFRGTATRVYRLA